MRASASVLLAALGLAACTPPAEVGWVLQDDGVLVVREKRQTTTRTPLGMEEVVLELSSVWTVEEPGRVGVDEVAWREEVATWTVTYSTLREEYTWSLGSGRALADRLAELGPSLPRRVRIDPTGDVRVTHLEAPVPESEDAPPIPWTENDRVYTWVAGFAHAPSGEVGRGSRWSWQSAREVTPRTSITTTSTWEYQGTGGGRAMLHETMTLDGSSPPSAGFFETTAVRGGADLRLDVANNALVSYMARYEADIASPSARGTAVRISEVSLEAL